MVEYCFRECVKTFEERQVLNRERKCVEGCSDKYLQSYDRALQRMQQLIIPKNRQGNLMA